MKRTSNGNIIYAQTKDYCAIGTTNFLETVSKMSSNGWTLIEQIEDGNSVILCFGKGDLLNDISQGKKD